RVPQPGRRDRQEWHRQQHATGGTAAGRGARGSGSRRGFRHHPSLAHLLCRFHEGSGARPGAPAPFRGKELVIMDKPIRLEPSLREKVWGRTHLAPWFPDAGERVGEAWYLADRELPLLVKLIFTSERLSVQVHPGDGEDGPRGKTEMWYILAADPGATIALGFREPLTRERLREATLSGEIER